MLRRAFVALSAAAVAVTFAAPASADHTNPTTPQSAIAPGLPGGEFLTEGAGTWDFITNFPPNPGSDLVFFKKGGDLYSSSGTLGQANAQSVGQRILRLVDDGNVAPTWIADHGSAKCQLNTSTTGLQHDAEVTPQHNPRLLIDTTDATGRCHDTGGGGLELIDISSVHTDPSTVRELHLIRHTGTSHTMTTDPSRPGILYNSTSDSRTPNLWIDVVDARSCFAKGSLERKRELCRPQVYRLSWQDHPEWTQRDPDGEEGPMPNEGGTAQAPWGSAAACHDITVVGDLLYCASLQATMVLDIGGIFDSRGRVQGTPLTCPVIPGTNTGAMVTDCSVVGPNDPPAPAPPTPKLSGWEFLGNYNHPGRVPNPSVAGNLNMEVPSDEGVSVSHESDPTPDGRYLLVTDERGGGIVPPGASCSPGIDNPFGNGGMHVYDLGAREPDLNGGPAYFPYAQLENGDKAIWRGDIIVPAPTFCTIHVIHHMPDEARIFVAYYSQGIKVLDYSIDADGQWTFTETASLTLPGDNDWVAEPFKVVDNPGGTRTYFIMASDISRGIDIVSWTGPKNPLPKSQLARPSAPRAMSMGNVTLLVLAVVGLPLAARLGRRRRRS